MIICTYGPMTDAEVSSHKPKVVLLDGQNRIKEIRKF